MELTETHFKVLEAIEREGGEARVFTIATKLGMKIDATRKLCTDLAEEDYIDLYRSGACVIQLKGFQALRERGGG